MEGGLLLDVVVRQGAAVLQLLAGEDQTLLIRWDDLLVLDLGLDVVDGVRRLDIEGDLRGPSRSSRRSANHHGDAAQDERWPPSGCCTG